jgi:hypothetical protein
VTIPLTVIEDIVSRSGAAGEIEQMLPAAVRGRQLKAGTLLAGMLLALADGRPAHLTRAHAALTSLPEHDQKRLGVIEDWADGPHQLTYRQVEHTSRLITRALAKAEPDGAPSAGLQQLCGQLTEASIPGPFKNASTSLAADWTDVEAWARPVPHDAAGTGAGPEASWGHRNVNRKIQEGEMFYGYYLPAAVMTKDGNGQPVPGLTRRITVANSRHDPAAALAGVLTSMPASGIALGDIIAGSGYSHRQPGTWAQPLRAAAASLVQDLHPKDRGPRGTHHGAVICNGNLYCPATPKPLLELVPPPPGTSSADTAVHDQQTAELARYKPGVHASEDAGGYRRHACPAAAAKIRCAPRPWHWTAPGRRSSARRSIRRPAAPSRPSPPAPAPWPRPGRNTTTRQRHGGPPTGGAPPPNGSTPPSKTPPPPASTAAGSARPASPRSCCGSPASSPCATSAPWPPSRPTTNTTHAPPPSHAPANGAANTPAPQPARPNHARQHSVTPAAASTSTASAGKPRPHPGSTDPKTVRQPDTSPRTTRNKINSARQRECRRHM